MAHEIRFDDGAFYERNMGVWSRIVGEQFLAWVRPPSGQHWLDVGCGNGAFTELIMRTCAPSAVHGIDPSAAQIAYALQRPGAAGAQFTAGDAMDIPYGAGAFDIAASALVLFFVPDPIKAVREMARVTRPGGIVCAYVWDVPGGGLPNTPIAVELRKEGIEITLPPSSAISPLDALADLFVTAGLEDVETRSFEARRTFQDFDDWWGATVGSMLAGIFARLGPVHTSAIRDRVRLSMDPSPGEPIVQTARANAVKARVA